jgi:outer membrane protein assembly factor BamB
MALCCMVFALAVVPAQAADWPGWRGPDRTGVSHEKGLLSSWPKGGPPLVWTAEGFGEGYSPPSVVGPRLYVMGAVGGEEHLFAHRVSDGKRLWSLRAGKVGPNDGPQYPGPRSSPTVDGDRVYAVGSDGDLLCAEAESGKLLWRKQFKTEFDGAPGAWAYCESVLIDGDLLVCTPGGPKAAMLGLDKMSGKTVWQTPIEDGHVAGFASPVVAQVGKVKLYVQFMGAALVGVDARTGRQLWRYRKNVGGVCANTPVVDGDLVFSTAAGTPGAGGDALLQMTADEKGGVSVKQVYLKRNLMTHHGGVVLHGGHLYGTGSTGLICMEMKTGDVKWRDRSVGSGSLIIADGHVYLRGTGGQMALVEANAAKYVEKGRFTQAKRSRFPTFTHPVIADGRLYLRDGPYLFCYDVRAR